MNDFLLFFLNFVFQGGKKETKNVSDSFYIYSFIFLSKKHKTYVFIDFGLLFFVTEGCVVLGRDSIPSPYKDTMFRD